MIIVIGHVPKLHICLQIVYNLCTYYRLRISNFGDLSFSQTGRSVSPLNRHFRWAVGIVGGHYYVVIMADSVARVVFSCLSQHYDKYVIGSGNSGRFTDNCRCICAMLIFYNATKRLHVECLFNLLSFSITRTYHYNFV